MTEPTASITVAAGTLAHSLAVPVLAVAGVSLGLRADVLLAGFAGSVAAMSLLNTVPGTGDTWRELVRTTLRRFMVAISSAMTAGYVSPLAGLVWNVPEPLALGFSFVVGAGAQAALLVLLARFFPAPAAPAGAPQPVALPVAQQEGQHP